MLTALDNKTKWYGNRQIKREDQPQNGKPVVLQLDCPQGKDKGERDKFTLAVVCGCMLPGVLLNLLSVPLAEAFFPVSSLLALFGAFFLTDKLAAKLVEQYAQWQRYQKPVCPKKRQEIGERGLRFVEGRTRRTLYYVLVIFASVYAGIMYPGPGLGCALCLGLVSVLFVLAIGKLRSLAAIHRQVQGWVYAVGFEPWLVNHIDNRFGKNRRQRWGLVAGTFCCWTAALVPLAYYWPVNMAGQASEAWADPLPHVQQLPLELQDDLREGYPQSLRETLAYRWSGEGLPKWQFSQSLIASYPDSRDLLAGAVAERVMHHRWLAGKYRAELKRLQEPGGLLQEVWQRQWRENHELWKKHDRAVRDLHWVQRRSAEELRRQPLLWRQTAWRGSVSNLTKYSSHYHWGSRSLSLICWVVFGSLLPVLACQSALVFLTAEAYRQAELFWEKHYSKQMPSALRQEMLIHSQDELERQSLFIGDNLLDGTEVLEVESERRTHVYLTGATQTGKTSLGMTRRSLREIVMMGRHRDRWALDIDPKGSPAEIRMKMETALEWDVPVYLLNLSGGPSHVFNVFAQREFTGGGLIERYELTEVLLNVLGLNTSEERFWTAINQLVFNGLLKDRDFLSYRTLQQKLRFYWRDLQLKDALVEKGDHVLAALDRACRPYILNYAHSQVAEEVWQQRIDFGKVLSEGGLVLFHLPSLVPELIKTVVMSAIYSLFAIAAKKPACERLPGTIFIDEVQMCATDALSLFYNQAAGEIEISLCVANQTPEDLERGGKFLRAAVEKNSQVTNFMVPPGWANAGAKPNCRHAATVGKITTRSL